MRCPKCNTDEHFRVNEFMLVLNQGPEGPLHEVSCTKCNTSMHSARLPEHFTNKEVRALEQSN